MALDRLAVVSHRMAALSLGFVIVMLALNAAVWLFPQLSSMEGGSGLAFYLSDQMISMPGLDLTTYPLWQKLGAILLSSIPLLMLTVGLLNLRALFKNYATGDYFSPSSSACMEKMGRAVAAWVALNIVCEPLLSLWLTMREPAGQRLLSLSFDSAGAVALFLAACIIVIARILRRASEINDENQQFV
ncbi:DUF2975 domain-containing protein [Affinibrenneria salicis]|uniref:DUF2975 domain-containing protein n=1 Tax=Affinibrenneria salicis TaxID=2590031 RepID=A0A5J5FTZ7_9GAMM|nr:DUF2975 domain-containing protein [Affinibrenneria salicis]KAA8996126.1 DUF2975 domain-containing protein [Affinibrenneria salicis]